MIQPLQHIDTTTSLKKFDSVIDNFYTINKACDSYSVRIHDPVKERIDAFINTNSLNSDEIDAFNNSKSVTEFVLTCDISNFNYKKIITEMLSTKESSKAIEYAISLFDSNELSLNELKQMLFKLAYKIELFITANE